MSAKKQTTRSNTVRHHSIRGRKRIASHERYQMRELLKNLASMLMTSGYNASDITRDLAAACRQLTARKSIRSANRSSKIDHMHVISHWYRDPDFLDSAGKPRKLPIGGAQPSLTKLIARVLPGAAPRGVLESLTELGAVRQCEGRYEPTGIQVNFDGDKTHWAYWNMKALNSVLQNMTHNLSCDDGNLYLAKAAINPRFPVSELPNFHARMGRRALRYLSDIDAGMQRLEVSGRQQMTTEAGVLIFSFENPTRSVAGGPKVRKRALRKSSRLVTSD